MISGTECVASSEVISRLDDLCFLCRIFQDLKGGVSLVLNIVRLVFAGNCISFHNKRALLRKTLFWVKSRHPISISISPGSFDRFFYLIIKTYCRQLSLYFRKWRILGRVVSLGLDGISLVGQSGKPLVARIINRASQLRLVV